MTKANRLGFPPVPTFVIEGTLRSQALKVLEEAAELVEAAKELEEDSNEKGIEVCDAELSAAWNMLCEAADVNQALVNLMAAARISARRIDSAAKFCTLRNIERGRVDNMYEWWCFEDMYGVEEGRDA